MTKVPLSQLEKMQRESKRKSGQKKPRRCDYRPSQDFASAFSTEAGDETDEVEEEDRVQEENPRKKAKTGARSEAGAGEGIGVKQVCGRCGEEKSRSNMSRHKKSCGK